MQYNVSGGKKVRGLTVVYSYRMLAPENELTPENIRLAQILGWCVEMVSYIFSISLKILLMKINMICFFAIEFYCYDFQ